MDMSSPKPPKIEVNSYKPSGMSLILSWFGKKNKNELTNSILEKYGLKLNSLELGSLTLNTEGTKELTKAMLKPKGSGTAGNLFPKKQLGITRGELLSTVTKLKSNVSKTRCFGSCTSLSVTTNQKNCKMRKVGKKSFRSVVESSSSRKTLTVNFKKSSKLITPTSNYNNILMTSITPDVIDSNIEHPVFVPIGSIGKINMGINSPTEPDYIQSEVLRDLENKTKVIPVLMKTIESIGGEVSIISKTTNEIKTMVSEKNLPNELYSKITQFSDSLLTDRPKTRKATTQLTAKKNKRNKEKHQKTFRQSSSVSWKTPFSSESSNNLNLVFGPKLTSSASTLPIKSLHNASSGPIQDGNNSGSLNNSNVSENAVQSGEGDVHVDNSEEDWIKFSSEKKFAFDESGYLDRKKREMFDEGIRSITNLFKPRTTPPRKKEFDDGGNIKETKAMHQRFGSLLEGIKEVLEESEEELESLVEASDNETCFCNKSVSVQTDWSIVGLTFEHFHTGTFISNTNKASETKLNLALNCRTEEVEVIDYDKELTSLGSLNGNLTDPLKFGEAPLEKDSLCLHLQSGTNAIDLETKETLGGIKKFRVGSPPYIYNLNKHLCSHPCFLTFSDEVISSNVDIMNDAYLLIGEKSLSRFRIVSDLISAPQTFEGEIDQCVET